MKTNQLHLGVILTQKVQNNYLIPFVTFLKCEQKSIFLKKPKLVSSGVFWNGYDFRNICVCLCVFVCLSVLWIYVCIHMHVHVPLCTLNLIATVFGPDL